MFLKGVYVRRFFLAAQMTSSLDFSGTLVSMLTFPKATDNPSQNVASSGMSEDRLFSFLEGST